MAIEVFLTRRCSVAAVVERLLRETLRTADVALYRLNHLRLTRALEEAAARGVRVRLALDENKYEETAATRALLSSGRLEFRLLHGKRGPGSKMHHKFAVLDGRRVLTGSYNWTLESEELNYENLLVLRGPRQVAPYRREFLALWRAAKRLCPATAEVRDRRHRLDS